MNHLLKNYIVLFLIALIAIGFSYFLNQKKGEEKILNLKSNTRSMTGAEIVENSFQLEELSGIKEKILKEEMGGKDDGEEQVKEKIQSLLKKENCQNKYFFGFDKEITLKYCSLEPAIKNAVEKDIITYCGQMNGFTKEEQLYCINSYLLLKQEKDKTFNCEKMINFSGFDFRKSCMFDLFRIGQKVDCSTIKDSILKEQCETI